jgi:hypothetical protein
MLEMVEGSSPNALIRWPQLAEMGFCRLQNPHRLFRINSPVNEQNCLPDIFVLE